MYRTALPHLLNEIHVFTKIVNRFLQKSSRKKVPPELPRIEKSKFANKIFQCFLSPTFPQKKMQFWGISRSTDEIEQYGKQSSLKFLCFIYLFFFSATVLQNNTQILWTVRSTDEIEQCDKRSSLIAENCIKSWVNLKIETVFTKAPVRLSRHYWRYAAIYGELNSPQIVADSHDISTAFVRYSTTFVRLCTT